MEPLEAWLTLRSMTGISDGTICRLVRHFGGPGEVLSASAGALRQAAGTSARVDALLAAPDRGAVEYVRKAVREVERGACAVVTMLDAAYPARLAMIPDPPPLLYVRGTLPPPDDHAVAIVGSRAPTAAGARMTEALARSLAETGFTIVSGLARGIDAAAHRGALAAETGATVAVLGCGVDRTYPSEHASLRREIEARGAVVSELPLGAPPLPHHFPLRNRIVSGLSMGVVVAEAGLKSGALITARFALEQNRGVFAVPGSVGDGKHQGTHWLIKQGAALVEAADDVVDDLRPQLAEPFRNRVGNAAVPAAAAEPDVTEEERRVLALFNGEPVSVDEVLARASLDFAAVMNILLGLELKGMLKQVPGSCYIRQ